MPEHNSGSYIFQNDVETMWSNTPKINERPLDLSIRATPECNTSYIFGNNVGAMRSNACEISEKPLDLSLRASAEYNTGLCIFQNVFGAMVRSSSSESENKQESSHPSIFDQLNINSIDKYNYH